jgi:hypothetical protein
MYGKQEFRGANKKERKENVIAIILSGIIAFLYISGIPSTLFVNIKVADVDPVSITIFINIILTLAVGISLVKILIPSYPPYHRYRAYACALAKTLIRYALSLK